MQPVFNQAACFVVNFTAVRARFDHRLFIAKRLLKTRPTPALLPSFYLVSSEPQILKFNSRCFAPKFRQNFTRRAAEFRSFIQSHAGSRKTRAIKFTPPLYGFVLSAQHFIAAETMYFRGGAISSPYSLPNRCRLNFTSKRAFKISSNSRRMQGSRDIA